MQSANWACAACTFLNSDTRQACEICSTARPQPLHQQQQADPPSDTSITRLIDIWECTACTFENPSSADQCDMCSTAKPESVEKDSHWSGIPSSNPIEQPLCPMGETCSTYLNASNYTFDKDTVHHLESFYHAPRPLCRYGRECHAFTRMESSDAYRLDDQCHLSLYSHPPRNRAEKLPEGYNPMSVRIDYRRSLRFPRLKIKLMFYGHLSLHDLVDEGVRNTWMSDLIQFLIIEVIDNNFGRDLILWKSVNFEQKLKQLNEYACSLTRFLKTKTKFKKSITDYNNLSTYLGDIKVKQEVDFGLVEIMEIVEEKLNHPRHLKIPNTTSTFGDNHELVYTKRLNYGEMLAVILYSGCDCNYDLCEKQRYCSEMSAEEEKVEREKEDSLIFKWSIFEWCLVRAIVKLHDFDTEYSKCVPVYSGIPKVFVDSTLKTRINSRQDAQFASFVSASRSIEVAKEFRGNDGGMLFRIDPVMQQRLFCCDVSWISKFPDEKEVLFAPGTIDRWNIGDVVIFREESGVNQYFCVVKDPCDKLDRPSRFLM